MHYFAYGVNLNTKVLRGYCPLATFISPAYIFDHKLIFDGKSIRRAGATANIRVEINQIVWGALFEIEQQELDQLDSFENYPVSYLRKKVTAVTAEGRTYPEVWTYFREGQHEGTPGLEYFSELIEGAVMCNLPSEYITALKSTVTL